MKCSNECGRETELSVRERGVGIRCLCSRCFVTEYVDGRGNLSKAVESVMRV